MPVDTAARFWRYFMCLYPSYVKWIDGKRYFSDVPLEDYIPIPCGSCFECCTQYTNEWSARLFDELKYHNGVACCLTLTYDNEHLPKDGSVNRRDYQLFLKLFRKKHNIRYFGCAEYGGEKFRPHYHIIIFGYEFPDKYYWCKSKSDGELFRSSELETFWKSGYSYIGKFDMSTVRYCTKYLQKYLFCLKPEFRRLTPPFTFMSTHPGLGRRDYSATIDTDKVYYGGKWVKTPRYYLKRLELQGYDLTVLKANRRLKSTMFVRDEKSLKILRKSIDKRLGLF